MSDLTSLVKQEAHDHPCPTANSLRSLASTFRSGGIGGDEEQEEDDQRSEGFESIDALSQEPGEYFNEAWSAHCLSRADEHHEARQDEAVLSLPSQLPCKSAGVVSGEDGTWGRRLEYIRPSASANILFHEGNSKRSGLSDAPPSERHQGISRMPTIKGETLQELFNSPYIPPIGVWRPPQGSQRRQHNFGDSTGIARTQLHSKIDGSGKVRKPSATDTAESSRLSDGRAELEILYLLQEKRHSEPS